MHYLIFEELLAVEIAKFLLQLDPFDLPALFTGGVRLPVCHVWWDRY